MGFTSFEGLWSGKAGRGAGRSVVAWVLSSAFAMVGAMGCGVQELPSEEWGLEPRMQEQALVEDNGLSLNGLSLNGLSTKDFSNWFNGNPAGNDRLMRYLVRCAVPVGQTRDFTNPATGTVYSWPGVLGLAPAWAGGARATVTEQQVISACLAAHANNYGLNVPISMLGRNADEGAIPFSSEELSLFSKRESCFFGNIFNDEGLFAGNDRYALADDESTSRPCGLKSYGAKSNPACEQVKRIGQCEDSCTLEPNGLYYAKCTVNGVQYKPLTTRIRAQDIHRCGDGVCQQGESCGWGITADSCLLDCGSCAP
ncbi:hypothetical protein [Archangium sp.]|uniref:hypothetical protein n=1 Tax=Archangium sp. TaxID=1872627 RepID=UPI002D4C8431|nr:hypothetical protein [Archangium sp.]HYO57041.1 hypothetical protein [Archangium sp.]